MGIISLSGKIGAGKDLVASLIQEEGQKKWEIKKFAGKLKQISSILTGIPIENFEDQEFKKLKLSPEWGNMTCRELLQKVGTDCMRDNLHENTWVNALFSEYYVGTVKVTDSRSNTFMGELPYEDNWIISDTRFPNEYNAVKKRGGITIRVERPSIGQTSNHISETALDDYNFDKVIVNDGSIDDLREKVKDLIKEFNL